MVVEPITVLCVQVGNYCGQGEKYVRILLDQIARNLESHRFICVTDSPIEGIECVSPPEGLRGWWAKLWLFERFKGPCLYFDLDTCITGPLEPLTECQSKFAVLRDFYRQDGYGSGVMFWNGDYSYIWKSWDEAGRPEIPGGDQAWLEKVVTADRLQDLFPGMFYSFKVDASESIPQFSSVVCFHGKPRPHELTEGWVPEIWKIGGLAQPRFIQTLNTSPIKMLEQAEQNLKRDLPMFTGKPKSRSDALIVGGAPSLKDTLPHLRQMRDLGGHIFSVNATHDWLIERGIVPDFHVTLDARPENAVFLSKPHKDCTYLVAAQAHPSVFEALEGHKVIMWVAWLAGMQQIAERFQHKPIVLVGGGNTVGLKTMCLAYLWGYRRIRLYGFDSSYRDGENHAYKQPLNDGEKIIDITAAGKKFTCARWMARQAQDFQKQAVKLLSDGVNIHVYGEGLIPHIWRVIHDRP